MQQQLPRSPQDEAVVSRRQLIGAAAMAPIAAGLGLAIATQHDENPRAPSTSYRLTPHIRAYYDAARF